MDRRKIRIKPGRAQSMMGFVVGIIFVCIGVFLVLPAIGLFGLLWTGMAAAITVVNGINAFGKKGVPTMEIYTEDEAPPLSDQKHVPTNQPDAKGRLEQLKSLKEAGLITQEEYDRKRKEILEDL